MKKQYIIIALAATTAFVSCDELTQVLETTNTSQSGNLTVANVPILIGYRADGAKYYKYYMDEIAYFTDICLTAKQIKDMYNDGTVTNSFAGVRRG